MLNEKPILQIGTTTLYSHQQQWEPVPLALGHHMGKVSQFFFKNDASYFDVNFLNDKLRLIIFVYLLIFKYFCFVFLGDNYLFIFLVHFSNVLLLFLLLL